MAWLTGGAVAAVAIGVVLQIWPGHAIDLAVYRLAARTVLHDTGRHQDLYAVQTARRLPFTYPPFAVLPVLPVAFGRWALVRFVVRVVLAFVLAGLWQASLRATGRRVGWPLLAALSVLSLVLEPVIHDFWAGQLSLVVVLLVVVDLTGAVPERYRGLLTGVAAGLKLTPLIFVVFLALTRQWRALARLLAGFAGTVLIGFAVFPHDSWAYWTRYVHDSRRVGPPRALDDQSVRGALARLGLGQHGLADRLVLVAVVVVVAGTALVLAARWWRRGEQLLGVSLAGLASVLASPISWVHHWCWMLPLLIALSRLSYAATVLLGAAYCAAIRISRQLDWNRSVRHWDVVQQLVGNAYVWVALLLLAYAAWRLRPGRPGRPGRGPGWGGRAPDLRTTATP